MPQQLTAGVKSLVEGDAFHIDADVEHLDLFTFDAGCLVDDRLGLVAEKDLQIFQTVLVAAGVIDSFRINADGFLEAAAAAIAWSDYL